MANTIPPIPGIKVQQLRKPGWTVIGGNPAAKVAHFPKTSRTPAPRFPKHRIRTTWGFKDDVWTILEDSVNIDELEGIYGELPEGMIASITLFALPEGEEEALADSDVEPLSVPKSKKDEASLRAEAASIEHQLTHRPKNPSCPVCAKMLAPQARRKGGSSTFHSKAFGDHITVDHIITRDAKDYGFQDETVAHVVKDVFSKFRYVYPSASKSGEQCHEDMLHFLAVDDNVKVLYSDNAIEFDYVAKQLRCRHNTSRAYVDENKAVIEREIRTILEGTRSNLVQSGLPDRYWPLAAQHHAMCLNITKRLDNGQVPWEIRFGEPFNGKKIPFGAKRLYWAPPKQKTPQRSKFAGTGIEGIFLGYHIQPGFVFKAEYLVAPLYEIHNAIKNDAFKVFRTKRLETLEGDFVYPLVDAEDEPSKPPDLDDQHHNVIEDRNPHPPLEEGGGKDLFGDINFDGSPLSEFYKPGEIREQFGDLFDDVDNAPLEDAEDIAAREGESEETLKARKRAALLDDVPHSIKRNLAAVSGPAPPHGYFWNGECLILVAG